MMRSASFGNPAARLLFVAAAVCFSAFPSTASADLLWNWSFANEAGTFSTNGTPINATGAFNFTITNFTVTASAKSELIAQPYLVRFPPQGFLWDGVQATQFYHNSLLYTDYSEFIVLAGNADYHFRSPGVQWAELSYYSDDGYQQFSGPLTLTLSSSAVPEIDPAGIGSVLTLVAGALGLVERRRLASV